MKQSGHFLVRKPELDALSLQSMEGHLQTSMEVWVDNNKSYAKVTHMLFVCFWVGSI